MKRYNQRQLISMQSNDNDALRQIRLLISVIIGGLIISGLTAFPIQTLLGVANDLIAALQLDNSFSHWISFVYQGVSQTYVKYPFVAYGTDWLAFAHIVIAILFIGPWRDPVRNIWVIEFGLIASILIFPLAFLAGHIRAIPFFWQCIDCSFGVIAGGIFWTLRNKIKKMKSYTPKMVTTKLRPSA
jgi:hypothetical protein